MNILKQLRAGVICHSIEETNQLALAVGKAIPPDHTLALHGGMGSGKTTFVKGLAEAFGIEETILSPTFNLLYLYESEERNLIHIDAFRLENSWELEDLMIESFLDPPYCLIIEWAERVASFLPDKCWDLDFELVEGLETGRKITLR